MTPEFFSSSYRQYKNDTSAFTTWLGRAAESCGYKPKPKQKLSETAPQESSSTPAKPTPAPTVPAPRLKGKARKAAKQAQSTAEPVVSQEDDYVPGVKEVYMPSGIRRVLERAIDARQRCSDWYESAKKDAAFMDNGGHRHFIDILQDALSKLSGAKTTAGEKSTRPAASARPGKDTANLENRFAALEVEDTDESFELSPADVALATTPSRNKVDSVDVFVLEAEQAFDDEFAVFCFFEDLHRIRATLQKLWKRCISGRTYLVTATAITQYIRGMIQRAERDLCSRLRYQGPADDCYKFLASRLVVAEIITKGINPLQNAGVDITPFDKFIFLPVGRTVLKYSRMANVKEENAWPAPILPITFSYLSDVRKAETAEHTKIRKNDELLSQMLLDIQLPDHAASIVGRSAEETGEELRSPQEDVILKTMRPTWQRCEVSLTTVFMAQILLDISELYGPQVTRLNGQLRYAGKYASKSYDFRISPEGVLSTGSVNWPFSATKSISETYVLLKRIKIPSALLYKRMIMQVTRPPKLYTYETTPSELRERFGFDERPPPEIQRAMNHLKPDFVRPSPDHDFAETHNPLFPGGVTLRLLLQYHKDGLALANHHFSIFLTAHLYNALLQLKMLDQRWPIMDRIIELHKKAIFASEIPTKTKDIADRLSYRLNDQKRFRDEQRYKMRELAAAEPLQLLLQSDDSAQARSLFQIEQRVETTNKETSTALLANTSHVTRKRKHRVTPDRFVEDLEKTISTILDDLSIDYIRRTKKCITLLDTFRKMWNIEIQAQGIPDLQFDAMRTGNNTQDMGLLLVCLKAFDEAKAVREQGIYTYRAGDGDDRPVKGFNTDVHDPWRHGMGLLTASKVFKNFLSKDEYDFRFPLKFADAAVLDSEVTEGLRKAAEISGDYANPQLATAAEFHAVLAESTYVVVSFYWDYERKKSSSEVGTYCADFQNTHGIPSILAFARVNADDMPEISSKYCKEAGREMYVFFKEGKQVAVMAALLSLQKTGRL